MRRITKWGGVLLGGLVCGLLVAAGTGHAQLLDKKAISLALAKKMVAAATAEAVKNKWLMVMAVVDEDGLPILLEKMDGAPNGSVLVAEGKARTAALFRQPTKLWGDMIAGNPGATPPVPQRSQLLALVPGFTPVQGGLPVAAGDQVIGGIGCSGGSGAQDEQVCKAGVDALTK